MHNKTDQDNLMTRIVENPDADAEKADLDARLGGQKTAPSIVPAREQYTDSELIRVYRKAKGITTGFYRRYTQVVVAAGVVAACGGMLIFAGHKTDWFGLAEDVRAHPKAESFVSPDSYTDADVDTSDWVNPLWQRVYGDEGDKHAEERRKRGKTKKR